MKLFVRASVLGYIFALVWSATALPEPVDQVALDPPLHEESQAKSKEFVGILANVRNESHDWPFIIKLLDPAGNLLWDWNARRDVRRDNIPEGLYNCIFRGVYARDVKSSQHAQINSTRILALHGHAALVIEYAPGTDNDKKIIWGACTDYYPDVSLTQTLEMVHLNLLAIATSGNKADDGINIYSVTAGLSHPPWLLQKIRWLRNVRAMVWRPKSKLLWAIGAKADLSGKEPSYGLLNAYGLRPGGLYFNETPIYSYTMPNATRVFTEFGYQPPLWDRWASVRDLVLTPDEKLFLIPTDTDLYAFDLASRKFLSVDEIPSRYLNGFWPTGCRVGKNRAGQFEVLPYSDIKSISFGPDDGLFYVQPEWKMPFATEITELKNGASSKIDAGGRILGARWLVRP